MELSLKTIRPYIQLLKPHYQIQFIEVIAGALLVNFSLSFQLFQSLVLLFITSHVLLYGGLYTMNDLRDVEEDLHNEHKKNRPIPSGRVSIRAARIFMVALIGAGLLLSFLLFGKALFFIHLLLVVLNVLYTYVFKRIPFVELFGNVFTHPPRLVMGILLAGGHVPLLLIVAYFWFIFGFTCARRQILAESRGIEHRPNMKYYTKERLMFLEAVSFVVILLIAFLDPAERGWYIFMVFLYSLLVFGVHVFSPVRSFFKRMYLR